jgi:hypothetical protein
MKDAIRQGVRSSGMGDDKRGPVVSALLGRAGADLVPAASGPSGPNQPGFVAQDDELGTVTGGELG